MTHGQDGAYETLTCEIVRDDEQSCARLLEVLDGVDRLATVAALLRERVRQPTLTEELVHLGGPLAREGARGDEQRFALLAEHT